MRQVWRSIAAFFLVLAVLLGMLTVAAWPPEGLFFGLTFFFLLPALLFGIVGALLWLCTRPAKNLPPGKKKEDLT